MDDELFNDLVKSIEEAGAWLRGEDVPVRVWVVDEPWPSEMLPSSEERGRDPDPD